MTQPATKTDPGFIQDLILGLGQAVSTLAQSNPITAALYDILPPLVRYVARQIDRGKDPRDGLYPVILAEADLTANEAEDLKFGPERPTKP